MLAILKACTSPSGMRVRLDEGGAPGPLDADRLDPVKEAAAPVAQVVFDDGPVVVLRGHFQEFFRLTGRQVLQVGRLFDVRGRCGRTPPEPLCSWNPGRQSPKPEYRLSFGIRAKAVLCAPSVE